MEEEKLDTLLRAATDVVYESLALENDGGQPASHAITSLYNALPDQMKQDIVDRLDEDAAFDASY